MAKRVNLNKCYLAYAHRYATGEGVTAIIAVAGTATEVRSKFKRHAPEYFWSSMRVASLAKASGDEVVDQFVKMIPPLVVDLLERNPRGTTVYYGELHYNLA